LGAVLAGGESSRYRAPKALATVGGIRIVDRVVAALRLVTPEIVISANEPGLFADLGFRIYPDEREDLGPLGGIYTVLRQARGAGRPGILAVACDMPFPSIDLLTRLRRLAFGSTDPDTDVAAQAREGPAGIQSGLEAGLEADVPVPLAAPDIVVPASSGPRGVEPLFAAYAIACLPAIEAAVAEGDRRMIGFHERLTVRTISLHEVEAVCDPARAFFNVNTPEDRDRAESMAQEEGPHGR
jgi:molybdopterin-guanine dinucleotide biosynthesis protein A